MRERPGTVRRLVVTLALLAAAAAVPATGVVGRATAAHAASDDTDLRAFEKVLAVVPASARGRCFRFRPAYVNADLVGATVAVVCNSGADGVDAVEYFVMESPAAFNIAYAEYFADADADGASPDPDACPTEGTWTFNDGTGGGAKACGDATNDAQLLWTSDADQLIGIAVSTSHDVAALAKWWDTDAAPIQQPDNVEFASVVPADRQAAAKKLSVQTGTSTKCKQSDADVSQLAKDGLAWSWLPWLHAAIRCRAPDNQGPVEYFTLAPEAATGFAARLKEVTVNNTKPTKHLAVCDDTRDLLGKKNQVRGQVGCFFVGGVLWAYWWHDSAKGEAPGMVGAMPADNFTSPTKFYSYLVKNKML